MECPYCHKEIPQDSAFCYHCGKEISADALKQKNKSKLKKNPRENSWAKLGILLFFIGLIGLDFIAGTISVSYTHLLKQLKNFCIYVIMSC